MLEFRRSLALLSQASANSLTARSTIERLAGGVEEDVLAPYLTIAVAALHGRSGPNEDELARVYGSSLPNRIRRLLNHLERSNLIALHEVFAGVSTISVLGWTASTTIEKPSRPLAAEVKRQLFGLLEDRNWLFACACLVIPPPPPIAHRPCPSGC